MSTNLKEESAFSNAEAPTAGQGYDLRRLAIEYLPTHALKLNPKNPRTHSIKQVKQIAKSIKELGFNFPVAINTDHQVIAGNGRLEAARVLGLSVVPTVVLDHLTPEQQIAFAIVDNKLTENSTWNETLLAEQIKFLSEVDLNFDLEITGFEIGEIDVLLEDLNANEGDQDAADVVPEVQDSAPVSKPGDLWLLNHHRVLCANCLDENSYSTLMRESKAAMVFIDPPFNVPINGHVSGLGSVKHREFAMACGEMSEEQFTHFLVHAFRFLARFSADGSIHYVCADWRHIGEFLNAGKKAYSEFKNLCVWVKDNAGMGTFYRSQHELVFAFKSGSNPHRNNFQLGQFGRYRTNVWSYGGGNSFSRNTTEGSLLEFHPTSKPVGLVADAIMDVTARGDIVLDSFLGSGSTLIACERTGRVCFGMEIDALYIDTIIRRWQRFTGLKAVHSESGRQFDELGEGPGNANI